MSKVDNAIVFLEKTVQHLKDLKEKSIPSPLVKPTLGIVRGLCRAASDNIKGLSIEEISEFMHENEQRKAAEAKAKPAGVSDPDTANDDFPL